MARFIGYVRGKAGEASRLGTPKSGLRVTANGWGAGIQVNAVARGEVDCFHVYATSGSSGGYQDRLIATVKHDAESGLTEVTVHEVRA